MKCSKCQWPRPQNAPAGSTCINCGHRAVAVWEVEVEQRSTVSVFVLAATHDEAVEIAEGIDADGWGLDDPETETSVGRVYDLSSRDLETALGDVRNRVHLPGGKTATLKQLRRTNEGIPERIEIAPGQEVLGL